MTGEHSVKVSEYLILKQGEGAWSQVGFQSATTPQKAIEAMLPKLGQPDQTGTFVAVAKARWNPVTVKPQVVTTFQFEQVKS